MQLDYTHYKPFIESFLNVSDSLMKGVMGKDYDTSYKEFLYHNNHQVILDDFHRIVLNVLCGKSQLKEYVHEFHQRLSVIIMKYKNLSSFRLTELKNDINIAHEDDLFLDIEKALEVLKFIEENIRSEAYKVGVNLSPLPALKAGSNRPLPTTSMKVPEINPKIVWIITEEQDTVSKLKKAANVIILSLEDYEKNSFHKSTRGTTDGRLTIYTLVGMFLPEEDFDVDFYLGLPKEKVSMVHCTYDNDEYTIVKKYL